MPEFRDGRPPLVRVWAAGLPFRSGQARWIARHTHAGVNHALDLNTGRTACGVDVSELAPTWLDVPWLGRPASLVDCPECWRILTL